MEGLLSTRPTPSSFSFYSENVQAAVSAWPCIFTNHFLWSVKGNIINGPPLYQFIILCILQYSKHPFKNSHKCVVYANFTGRWKKLKCKISSLVKRKGEEFKYCNIKCTVQVLLHQICQANITCLDLHQPTLRFNFHT